jgi:hypothetical protein
MSSNQILFAIFIGVLGLTGYLIATRPTITPEERKEMEEEWWS